MNRAATSSIFRVIGHTWSVTHAWLLAKGTRHSIWRGYAGALLFVALSTVAGLLIAPRWGTTAVDLLYLPAVFAAAALVGLGPGVFAAIVSTLAYNFFFTQPHHTFIIHSPSDVVTVIALFAVALVTNHLASSVRGQAQIARAHAERNATIAGLARRLLSCSTKQEIAHVATERLAIVFDCNAVFVGGGPKPKLVASAPGRLTLPLSDVAVAAVMLEAGDPAGPGAKGADTTSWQFHAIRSERQILATIGMARDDGASPIATEQEPLLDNLLDEIALALERARLEEDARGFAATRERDRTRSVLLSSIGQDVSPRLAAIRSAVGKLRRSGSCEKASLSIIAAETSKLERYMSDLAELGPGSEVHPVQLGTITIDLSHRSVRKRGEEIHLTPKEYAVLAELAKHPGRVLTHAHLLRTAWGPAQEAQTEYLRVAIRALRLKLEQDPADPKLIINEPAVGYRLACDI